jgi:hypothetical protein
MNKTKLTLVAAISVAISFTSCDKETPKVFDCNGIENGVAMIDSCGECQQAYIYDYVTHQTQMLEDTSDIELSSTEMIVFPNSPSNPFWNANCNQLVSGYFSNLNASNYTIDTLGNQIGEYTKFSFSEGDIVDGGNWDIGFSGTTIIVNGGSVFGVNEPNRTGVAAAYIVEGTTLSDVTIIDESLFLQDSETALSITDDSGANDSGWCHYDFITHMISPIAGKILVFRTHDGKFAKMEILSFYNNMNPSTNPYGGYFTFNYVYQANSTALNF